MKFNRLLRTKNSLFLKPKRSATTSQFKRNRFENLITDDSSTADDITDDGRDDLDYGEIQLFLKFSDSKLIVKVLNARNLMNIDKSDSNDKLNVYVRLLLLPDRKKRSKRKTRVVKDSLEPKWDEQFEYTNMSLDEAKTKKIDATVKNDRFIFSLEKTFMGQALIPLNLVKDIDNGHTSWYKLKRKAHSKPKSISQEC